MKKIITYIYFLLLLIHLDAQILDRSWFDLKGSVRLCSVMRYDIHIDNGLITEGFPQSDNTSYQTDLNLVYMEFSRDGLLTKSKLYYPRGYYGPFEQLSPVQNLEVSDFFTAGNFLTKLYTYDYNRFDGMVAVELTDSRGRLLSSIYKDGLLVEDDLYHYEKQEEATITKLLKRSKDSVYNYRRLEIESNNTTVVTKEFLNSRFLQSKKIERIGDNYKESIFISKSKVVAIREEYNNQDQKIKQLSYSVNWRHMVKNWPEIDFDEDLDYYSFTQSLKRTGSESVEHYEYSENQLMNRYADNNKYQYIYSDDGFLKTVMFNSQYKDYIYDNWGNWISKTVGHLDPDTNKRIPDRRYQRILQYY